MEFLTHLTSKANVNNNLKALWLFFLKFSNPSSFLFEANSLVLFPVEILKNFKSTYFEEHLQTTAPKWPQKISPLLVLGKAMLDGRKHIWTTNTLYFKYEPHLVSLCNIHLYQNAFCYFLQASEEGKNDNDIDFRVFWASYSEKTILDKEIKSLGLESLHILLIFSTFIQFIFILTK